MVIQPHNKRMSKTMINRINPYGCVLMFYPSTSTNKVKKEERKVEAISKSKSVIIEIRKNK